LGLNFIPINSGIVLILDLRNIGVKSQPKAKIKIITNNIEELFASNNKRQVNIDPGYISLENFILFTTKNYTHRIYLEQGIFADLTLIYEKRQFNTLPWTYPDYASLEIREFLKAVRENYRIEIKKEMQNENS